MHAKEAKGVLMVTASDGGGLAIRITGQAGRTVRHYGDSFIKTGSLDIVKSPGDITSYT
jgi:trans-2-enoyl-CoA reductase